MAATHHAPVLSAYGTPMSDENGNGKSASMIAILYRSALLGICGWVLVTVLSNNERNIEIKGDIKYFNSSVTRIETNMSTLVTKTELELTVTKLQNDQLKFQNEFLKAAQPQQQPQPTTKR
jgi:hypothetical protein